MNFNSESKTVTNSLEILKKAFEEIPLIQVALENIPSEVYKQVINYKKIEN